MMKGTAPTRPEEGEGKQTHAASPTLEKLFGAAPQRGLVQCAVTGGGKARAVCECV